MSIEEWHCGKLVIDDRPARSVQDVIQTPDAFECTGNHFGVGVNEMSHARVTTMNREMNKKAFFIGKSPFMLDHSHQE